MKILIIKSSSMGMSSTLCRSHSISHSTFSDAVNRLVAGEFPGYARLSTFCRRHHSDSIHRLAKHPTTSRNLAWEAVRSTPAVRCPLRRCDRPPGARPYGAVNTLGACPKATGFSFGCVRGEAASSNPGCGSRLRNDGRGAPRRQLLRQLLSRLLLHGEVVPVRTEDLPPESMPLPRGIPCCEYQPGARALASSWLSSPAAFQSMELKCADSGNDEGKQRVERITKQAPGCIVARDFRLPILLLCWRTPRSSVARPGFHTSGGAWPSDDREAFSFRSIA